MTDPEDPEDIDDVEDPPGYIPEYIGAKSWAHQVIVTETAQNGGVVRRSKASVLKHSTMDVFKDIAFAKCYHLIETRDQVIIICNSDPIIVHC